MHYTPEEEDRVRAEIDAAKADRSSASAPSETACQPRSLALARGWVPVASAERLVAAWRAHAAAAYKLEAQQADSAWGAKAETYNVCAENLSRLIQSATERQPAPNDGHQPRA